MPGSGSGRDDPTKAADSGHAHAPKRARDSAALWPQLAEIKADANATEGRSVVLLTTGSFNPIHAGHVAMMEAAKRGLEADGIHVAGGYISPNHDVYVRGKAARKRCRFENAEARCRLVEAAVEHAPWLHVSRWACEQDSFVDFPDVKHALEKKLGDAAGVLYVCGADHARIVRPPVSFVAIGRGEAGLPRHGPEDNTFAYAAPSSWASELSSTSVRHALADGDWAAAEKMLGTEVFKTIKEAKLYGVGSVKGGTDAASTGKAEAAEPVAKSSSSSST